MLNGWAILLGILCVLFVAAAFGQDPSDPNIITVTKQIDVAKLNENVEDLNRNVKTLTGALGKLNQNVETLTKTVGDLEKTVARIDERTKGILGWQYAIFGVMGAIFASMVVFFFTQWIPQRKIKSEGEAASTITAQASESDTTSTNPTQENEDKAASASSLPPEIPSDRKAVKELLKSYSPATEKKI